jgi:hypothetical protein
MRPFMLARPAARNGLEEQVVLPGRALLAQRQRAARLPPLEREESSTALRSQDADRERQQECLRVWDVVAANLVL